MLPPDLITDANLLIVVGLLILAYDVFAFSGIHTLHFRRPHPDEPYQITIYVDDDKLDEWLAWREVDTWLYLVYGCLWLRRVVQYGLEEVERARPIDENVRAVVEGPRLLYR